MQTLAGLRGWGQGSMASWGQGSAATDAGNQALAQGQTIAPGTALVPAKQGGQGAQALQSILEAVPGIIEIFKPGTGTTAPVPMAAPAPSPYLSPLPPTPRSTSTPSWVWAVGGTLGVGALVLFAILLSRGGRRRNPAYGVVPIIAAAVAAAGAVAGGALSLAQTAKAKKGTLADMQARVAKINKKLGRTGIFGPGKKKRAKLEAELAELEAQIAQVLAGGYAAQAPSSPVASAPVPMSLRQPEPAPGLSPGVKAGLGLTSALFLTALIALVVRGRRR